MEEEAAVVFHLFSNVPGSSVCPVLRKGQETKEAKLGKEAYFQPS